MCRIRTTPRYSVVYDGECSVCRRLAEALRRWDRRESLEIVPFQGPGVKDRFPWIAPEAFEASIQLIAPDGTTWAGAAAIEELLRILPGGRWIGWTFALPLARPLAERGYRLFAGNRRRMGCRPR